MKVDRQSMVSVRISSSDIPQQGSDFESLLSPFSEKGNAYWQHQNQLQPSALTFKPAITHAETKITPDNEPIKEPIILPITIDPAPQVTHIAMQIEKNTPSSITLSKLTIEQFVTHIKTSMEQPFEMLGQGPTYARNVGWASAQHARLSSTNIQSFKQYQLFADDMQVELTLNMTYLSKQDLTELKKLIQHYLSQKGYTLKQLMINGVKQ